MLDKDIKKFRKKIQNKGYKLKEKIAEGSFGDIFLAKDIKTKEIFVIKIVEIKTKLMKKQMKNEIQLLTQLSNNKKIIKLIDHFQYKKRFSSRLFSILVFEKMDMDLMDLILATAKLPLKDVKKIFYDICLAIKDLHDQGIAHLDIKPDNILLKKTGEATGEATVEVKLCDFGFANYLNNFHKKDKKMRKFIGTKEYSSPEIFYNNEEYLPISFQAEKSDIWSLGVTLFSLITKLFPFTYLNDRISDSTEAIFDFLNEYDVNIDDEENCLDLFTQMFKINSWERPSIDDILHHPWLNEIEINV